MAREGTRSTTGHSKPRIFQTIDTSPVIKRTTKPKTKTASKSDSKAKAAKPVGVTKKKAPEKKEGLGAKVKSAVKKAESKVKGEKAKTKKEVKPKTTTKA